MERGDIFFRGSETCAWNGGEYFVGVEGTKDSFGFDAFRVGLDDGFKGVFGRGDVWVGVRC